MPLPEVYAAVQGFKIGLAAEEAQLMGLMARRWVGVQDRLQKDIVALVQRMASIQEGGGAVSESLLWQEKRYQQLLAQTRSEVTKYIAFADKTIQAEQMSMGLLGQKQAGQALRAWGIGGNFSQLNPFAIRDMVGLTAKGAPVRELLAKSWPDAVEGMTKALVDGAALGWNPRKTAKAMTEGLDQGLERCLKIARTEQIRAYRTSTLERYRESGMVSGYRRLAAKQERTCIACLIEDGKFFPLDVEFEDHINGRCAAVPVILGREDEPLPVASGQDWFEGLDDEAQQRIMGQGKWQAWKDGEFALDDLVKRTTDSVWGTSLGTRSLGELQQ